MSGRLENKIALITGGVSGIGLGTVEVFLREGAQVVVADLQDEKGHMLEAKFGSSLYYVHCDVTREEEIAEAVAAAKAQFGGLDILFNNAGQAGPDETIDAITATAWDYSFALLVRSVVLGMKHASPVMKARGGGSIINTASIAGLQANCGPLAYSAAKAAVIHLTKIAAAELSPHKVRVNAVCPGLIATSIFGASVGLDRSVADQMAAQIAEVAWRCQPVPKPGLPSDIAEAVLFLASDAAAFVSGTSLVVDGAYTVGAPDCWGSSLTDLLNGGSPTNHRQER